MLMGTTPLAVAARKRFVIPGPAVPATNLLPNGDFEAGSTGITFFNSGFITFANGKMTYDDPFSDASGTSMDIYWDNAATSPGNYTMVIDVASAVRGSVHPGFNVSGSNGSATAVAPGLMTFPNIVLSGSLPGGSTGRIGLIISPHALFTLNGIYVNPT